MAEKIGIYVCHCGSNIAGTVDVEEVARWAGKNIKDVAVSRDYKFMCSSLGQQMIEDDIKKEGLTRRGRGGLLAAPARKDLPPRLRERRPESLPLPDDQRPRARLLGQHATRRPAREKAKALVSAAAERVKHQQPLEPMYVKVNPATLVVGGGIAGLQATLELADAGYPVYLVEREPSIGGHMAQFDKTFPTLDCSACILTPKMSEVGQHENVTMLTYSELEEVSGSVGNFKVKIRKKARYVDYDKCTGCGICIEKCPRKVVDDVFEVGMGYRKAIYTPFPQAVPRIPVIDTANLHLVQARQVPGLLRRSAPPTPSTTTSRTRSSSSRWATSSWPPAGSCSTASGFRSTATGGWPTSTRTWSSSGSATPPGPTNGKIVLRDGKTEPKSVAIIHCVGSRDVKHNAYCSSVCCMAALKFGHLVLEKTKAEVYSFYIDMRTPQKDYEEFYQRLLEEGMHFVRGKVAEVTDAARQPAEAGQADRPVRRHAAGQAARASRSTW